MINYIHAYVNTVYELEKVVKVFTSKLVRSRPLCNIYKKNKWQIQNGKHQIGLYNAKCLTLEPVSYTHLDVYKRQKLV